MTAVAEEVAASLEEAGLVYTTDSMPGITRRRVGDTFDYFASNGKPVTKESELQRIRSLGVPPAYEDVWICPLPNGHLQATGKDARGRKQYRYHPRFREIRDESKFERMIEFGEALPTIHARIDEDLSKRGFPREKVLATVVSLLEKSLVRVGNEEYAKENKHYGLTTLRNRHVTIEGGELRFSFRGKSGIKHKISLQDRRLARVVKKLQELPGQELFQYVDGEGNTHKVTSNEVNAYLKEISGHDFTAKDFRTWAGTVLAITRLLEQEPATTKKQAKSAISTVIKEVARELGNTPAICRKCYVHPAVLESFSAGTLHDLMLRDGECAEELVVSFLKNATPPVRLPDSSNGASLL
ncbi:MAG: DNA topoisomerase IB [Fimbriimonas sp.]